MGVSRGCHGGVNAVSNGVTEVSRVCPRCVKEISRGCHGCVKKVSLVCYGCVKRM